MRVVGYIKIASCCIGTLLSLCLTGCFTIGTKIISHDRGRYNFEIAKSENSQLLLNIVRLRYLDSIDFLQINSITAQKSLQGTGTGSWNFSPASSNSLGTYLGSTLNYTDTPTISFTPLQGAEFVKNLLTPVSLKSVYFLCNTGWDLEKVLTLSFEKMNNYYNQKGFVTMGKTGIPKGYDHFLKIVKDLRTLHQRNALDFYFRTKSGGNEELVIIFHPKQELALESEVKRLLHISTNAKFMIFTTDYYATKPKNTVAIKTHSIISMLSFLANTVRLPERDKNVVPFKPFPIPFMNIYSSITPVNASIHTYYRGHFFYIKETDASSKRTFLLLNEFYQLTAGVAGGNSGVVLSLSAGK